MSLLQRAAGEAVPVAVRHAAAAHHPRHPPGDAVGALWHPEERDAGGPRPQQRYDPGRPTCKCESTRNALDSSFLYFLLFELIKH